MDNLDEGLPIFPIGRAIEYRRKILKLTPEELAKKVGMKEQQIVEIEDDLKNQSLLLGTLIKIAKALNISIYRLIKAAEEHAYEINPNELDGFGSEDWFLDDLITSDGTGSKDGILAISE